jgi:DNA-binding HxlR family transcriptional regulator
VAATRTYGDPCGVARALDVVGERWALLVVRELLLGPKRFADLQHGLPAVSPNVLSQRLQALDEHGVVRRRRLGPPARVHVYELTEWGRELEPVLLHLGRWGASAPPLSDAAPLGVDSMMLSIKAAFDPARSGPDAETYEIRVDGDAFTVDVAGGRLDVRRASADRPAATATTAAATLRAVIEGHRTITDAMSGGDLALEGPAAVVERLTAVLNAAAPAG